MKAEIVNGCLVLTLPLGTPAPSASGKTLVVAVVAREQADDGHWWTASRSSSA